jgi:hypothetical protein
MCSRSQANTGSIAGNAWWTVVSGRGQADQICAQRICSSLRANDNAA